MYFFHLEIILDNDTLEEFGDKDVYEGGHIVELSFVYHILFEFEDLLERSP